MEEIEPQTTLTNNGSTLGQAPGLTPKRWARLERLAMDKRSSLLQKVVTYDRKKFYNIGPRTKPGPRLEPQGPVL